MGLLYLTFTISVQTTRAVQKVSSHFEYLENQSRGLDVTWHSVRGVRTVHPRTVTLPWGQSAGSKTPLIQLAYCVTVAFTMTERTDQFHHDNAPAHFTALVQVFFWGGRGKASHHPGLSVPPTAQIWLPATSDFSQS